MNNLDRRTFIKAGVVLTTGLSLGFNLKNRFDIIIKNGSIADGTGNLLFKADIGISGDRIEYIGDLSSGSSNIIIDAKGKIVAPGFIDIHTHTDTHLIVNPSGDSKLRQGITTEIGGNCGESVFPLDEDEVRDYEGSMKERHGIECKWQSMNDFYNILERRKIAINYGTFVGNGNLRAVVVGRNDVRATSEQMTQMKKLLEEMLSDGCMGLTSGLEYSPSSYADTEELTELAKVVAKYDAIYNTHMRNEDDTLLEAIDEAIRISKGSGCSLEIAHLKTGNPANWHKIDKTLEMLNKASKDGIKINADRYPYIAYSTGMGNFIPLWVRQGTTEDVIARLKDSSLDSKIKDYSESRGTRIGGWQNVVICNVRKEENKKYLGKSVKEAAEESGSEPYRFIKNLLIEENMNVSIVGFAMNEDNLKRILSHDLVMIGSDGSAISPVGKLGEGRPHPRYYGTFPRVLGKYCREEKIFGWETAVKKMTSMPADKLGLKGRGRLAKNNFADIVVFNPETIIDKATFVDPHNFAVGIDHVIVNGVHTIKDGNYTNALAGKIMRR